MELSGLTRHVPIWHLTVLSLVSFFQIKLTGTFPDYEAPGDPIEATLSGLLCVRHSASHFVSTEALFFFKARRIFSPGYNKPGLKNNTFSPRLLVPVGKPGVELVPNRD